MNGMGGWLAGRLAGWVCDGAGGWMSGHNEHPSADRWAEWVAGRKEWVAGWQASWATSNGQVAPAPIATRKASELFLKEF